MHTDTKPPVQTLGQAFLAGLRRILGQKLVAAYFYGAAAFPGSWPLGDVDFHVILAGALTEPERAELEAFHESLARQYPPLGGEMDGYYIQVEDARGSAPPRSEMWARAVDHSWALHRAHLLAGRCLVLYGPQPEAIYRPPTWPEIEAALWEEMRYVEQHLHDYPGYCVLNLCRLMSSFETRDVVVSKAQAADWAQAALPDWRSLIDAAVASYTGATSDEDRRLLDHEIEPFLSFARLRIGDRHPGYPAGARPTAADESAACYQNPAKAG